MIFCPSATNYFTAHLKIAAPRLFNYYLIHLHPYFSLNFKLTFFIRFANGFQFAQIFDCLVTKFDSYGVLYTLRNQTNCCPRFWVWKNHPSVDGSELIQFGSAATQVSYIACLFFFQLFLDLKVLFLLFSIVSHLTTNCPFSHTLSQDFFWQKTIPTVLANLRSIFAQIVISKEHANYYNPPPHFGQFTWFKNQTLYFQSEIM